MTPEEFIEAREALELFADTTAIEDKEFIDRLDYLADALTKEAETRGYVANPA